ncbi:hypothetical protein NPIL_530051 [Nephila pilipes]|uniref:Uncharacterized protein n=1 Tax=Nephila pilipes TaxID=299642 RepID=A0A8X6MQU0_NEPPI|nr:hypothetical protein NPIL_530051 [Nephila pilipes]
MGKERREFRTTEFLISRFGTLEEWSWKLRLTALSIRERSHFHQFLCFFSIIKLCRSRPESVKKEKSNRSSSSSWYGRSFNEQKLHSVQQGKEKKKWLVGV